MPEAIRDRAYADAALPIGAGQTISQPWIVAATCQALGLEGDETVLEVGGGSGYSGAVLGDLAARVISIELIPELAAAARAALAGLDGGSERVGAWSATAPSAASRTPPTTRSPSTRPPGSPRTLLAQIGAAGGWSPRSRGGG